RAMLHPHASMHNIRVHNILIIKIFVISETMLYIFTSGNPCDARKNRLYIFYGLVCSLFTIIYLWGEKENHEQLFSNYDGISYDKSYLKITLLMFDCSVFLDPVVAEATLDFRNLNNKKLLTNFPYITSSDIHFFYSSLPFYYFFVIPRPKHYNQIKVLFDLESASVACSLATVDDSTKGKGVHVQEGNDYDGLDDIWKEMTVALECSKMKNGKEFLLTDTIGFIQKLPTTLVAAFRATLEEISESSLLVYVVDISHPLAEQQIDAVDKVLSELDVASIPKLVWNQIDKASDPLKIKLEAEKRQDTVCISAINGDGLDEFCSAVQEKLKVNCNASCRS
ncbi:GTPase HflX, partial [Camellia lanceoleosa]